jgi:putative hydrolase of HD superfamily
MNCNRTISLFPDESLSSKFDFILELDKLKHVLRRTVLMDESRRDNAAEHSWEIATMALVLHEHAEPGTDLLKILKMLLIHDLVEIDTGDTYVYDQDAVRNQAEREARAADRIFGLLPEPHRSELQGLWKEFEARETADARFARAIDRLQPVIHNYCTKGQVWHENHITADRVRQTMSVVSEASDSLGRFSNFLIDDAVARGFLKSA